MVQMQKNSLILVVCSLIFLLLGEANAQTYNSTPSHNNELGFNFSVAMSGTGFGGFYRLAIWSYMHVGFNFNFFIMRDDKEFQYVDPSTGFPRTANKINRLYFIPVNIELKKRLFVNDIEDNFRPYITLQAGGIYGMNFPRAEELANQSRWSYNFVIGFGVDVKNSENFFIGVRPQYRIVYFNEEIAQKTNHSAFEIVVELGGRLK